MSNSKFIKDSYDFQIKNDKCMVSIERDDGHYNHGVMIVFSILKDTSLKFEFAIETNNKTDLQYTSEEDFEKMHHGLIRSVKENFKETR